jgi:vitamin B12 transporter
MTRTLIAAFATTTCLSALPAVSQDTIDLGTIVLSGGLAPVPGDAFGRASTVITEAELDARSEPYLADVLRTVPGLSVSRAGSFGGPTQVRIRGHEGNHTLVLIDGVKVNTVSEGEFDFSGLLTADIARIEVLRGPQSSIYGSNAIGGVVSITTRRATEPGTSGVVALEGGTSSTLNGLLALRQGFETGGLSFSVARQQTDGYDLSGEGGETDGDRNTTLNLAADFEIAPGVVLGGTLRSTTRRADFDAFNFGAQTAEGLVTDAPGSYGDVDELYGSLFLEAESFGGRLDNRLDLTFSELDRVSFGNNVKTGDSSGDRRAIAYTGTFALDAETLDLANQTLAFAIQYEDESYRENDPAVVFGPGQLEVRERSQTSYVLEYRGSYDFGLDAQASVRFDDNDAFEDFTTWAIGLSYTLPNGSTRLHASAGTGVQNPTLIEQFGFFSDFEGNPDLEPEQSRGFDIGVEQTFAGGAGIIDVTYFQEELTDEIGSVRNPVTGRSTPVNNIGTSDRRGVEVTAAYTFSDAFEASLAYTFLDATEEVPTAAGGIRDVVEVRRPEHDLYVQGTYRLPNDRTSITMGAQFVSGLYDIDFKSPSFGAERVKLDDYVLADISFRHEFDNGLALTGSITNLFDEDYQQLEGYATPGRELRIGLQARF